MALLGLELQRGQGQECQEVRAQGLRLLAEGGLVSLGFILNVLQWLFVLFFSWREKNDHVLVENII